MQFHAFLCGSGESDSSFLAIPAVPIPKNTAVLCGSDAVPIPVWNCTEPHFGFMRFYAVFAVPAVL